MDKRLLDQAASAFPRPPSGFSEPDVVLLDSGPPAMLRATYFGRLSCLGPNGENVLRQWFAEAYVGGPLLWGEDGAYALCPDRLDHYKGGSGLDVLTIHAELGAALVHVARVSRPAG